MSEAFHIQLTNFFQQWSKLQKQDLIVDLETNLKSFFKQWKGIAETGKSEPMLALVKRDITSFELTKFFSEYAVARQPMLESKK